ncbi:MAG: MATE family efflux transporter [Acidimicrobiia bacterium]
MNLSKKRIDAEILRLAIPALGSLLAEPLYILADTAVVGRLGTDRLAGLALASTILLVGYSIFIFLAYGTTAAVSRKLGANDLAGAAHQAVQSLWLAFMIGVVVAAVFFIGSDNLLGWLGSKPDFHSFARTYLKISLLGVPAMLVVLAGTGYLRGLQDTRTPLFVAVVSAVFNLVAEVILIYGFNFDIGASALTTVIAQYLSAGWYVYVIHRGIKQYSIGVKPDWHTIGQLGLVGRDLFLRTVALRGAIVATTAAAARHGATALGAHQLTFEIWNFAAMSLDAIAIAGQAMIGRFLGAGELTSAKAVGTRMLQWGFAAGAFALVAIVALHSFLPYWFTNDAQVAALAGSLLLVAAVAQPINGLAFVLDGLLIGASDMTFLAKAMLIAAVGYLILVVLVVWQNLAIQWLWWAFFGFMWLRFGVLYRRWRSGLWALTTSA